jgi:CheY-like chemotaxis protein
MQTEVNILLVEDEEIDIIDIQRLLNNLPIKYNLHIARNGEEAIETLNGSGTMADGVMPDIILLDLNMPRMNGFEVLSTITTSHKWGLLAVYIVTTSSDPVDRSAAAALNVKGYIEKPVRLSNIKNQQAIESMIDFIKELSARS